MRKLLILLVTTLCQIRCMAQFELVPYGDFEFSGSEVVLCPESTFNWPLLDSWADIGLSDGNAPRLYSTEVEYGGCSVPSNTTFGTQIPFGGTALNKNYIGLESGNAGLRRDGIKIKLTHRLRAGQQYTLRFIAVKKSNNDPEVEFRFGANDNWNQASCPVCSQSYMTIGADGGQNNDQWTSYSVSFMVSTCDIEWLFIRLQSSAFRSILLVDNISIEDNCAANHICRGDFGSLENITCNNYHDGIIPLTFYGCERIEDFTLEIRPYSGQNPIRTIHIAYPNSTISWDGKDDYGNYVADAHYVYTLDMKNSCQCRVMSADFDKEGDPHLITSFATTEVNYGLFTVFQLANVTQLHMSILDDNNNLVTVIDIQNPANAVSWNGKDASGDFVAEGYYQYDIYVANPCESVHLDGLFFQAALGPASQQSPNLDYSSYPKTIICPYVFNYYSYDYAPVPCCALTPDWYIVNKHLTGVQDYKIGHNIVAVQGNIVEAGSDIYFQAGNEIILNPEFTVELGAEFEAVILPCTGRMMNPNVVDSSENDPTAVTITNSVIEPASTIIPNPNNGEFTLSINNMQTTNCIILITDIVGRVVYTQQISNDPASKMELLIDISALGPGLYSCSIYDSEQLVDVHRIIVQ